MSIPANLCLEMKSIQMISPQFLAYGQAPLEFTWFWATPNTRTRILFINLSPHSLFSHMDIYSLHFVLHRFGVEYVGQFHGQQCHNTG